MALVLKMLYNRSAHLSVYTVQPFVRKYVCGDRLLCEKAPVTIDTQIEENVSVETGYCVKKLQ